MHFLLALAGVLLGTLAGGGLLGGALLGGVAGLLAAELVSLRQRVAQLESARRAQATQAPAPPEARSAAMPPATTPATVAAASASAAPAAVSAPPPAPDPPYAASAGDAPSRRGALGNWLGVLLTGGNTVARVGVLVLFFGVAFLLRYLLEHTHVPLGLRLTAVATGGALLLLLGVVLARRRRGYGLVLQAGGVGVMYLTAYVALSVYALLSPGFTFVALVVLAVLSAALAVAQSSEALSVLGVIGGFLAPLLTGTGADSPFTLLSYFLVLNGSIVGITVYRPWRALSLVGFVFTVVLGAWWGVQYYHGGPQGMFAVTEPFLVLFFSLYLALALMLALRQGPDSSGFAEGAMVFGAPVAALGFQAGLLEDLPHALAASALVLSGIYGLLSWALQRWRAPHRWLAQWFAALAVMCLTAALPLATHGRHWAAMWALEGAALVGVGCQQLRPMSRAAGALLIGGSGVLVWLIGHGALWALLPLSAGAPAAVAVDCATLGIAAVFSAVTLQRCASGLEVREERWPAVFFLWGLGWWLYGGALAIIEYVPYPYGVAEGLVFVSATALLAGEVGVRTPLMPARVASLLLLPVLDVFALWTLAGGSHPLANGGLFAWPLAFAAFYYLCARHEGAMSREPVALLHAAGALLLVALATWESAYQLGFATAANPWPTLGWALLPALLLAILPALMRAIAWPLRRHAVTYRDWVGGGIAAYLITWSAVSYCAVPHITYPGSLLPVLKGVDLGEVGVLLALVAYWRALVTVPRQEPADPSVWGVHEFLERAVIALVLAWLHVTLLRALHVWAGIDYELRTLLRSTLVQASLSIFWAGLALLLMVLATLRASRRQWLAGAVLLGAVIVKLFLVDFAGIGTIERIVSFLGVGVLTLVIGYFAPQVPVAAAEASGASGAAGPSGPRAPQEPPRA